MPETIARDPVCDFYEWVLLQLGQEFWSVCYLVHDELKLPSIQILALVVVVLAVVALVCLAFLWPWWPWLWWP